MGDDKEEEDGDDDDDHHHDHFYYCIIITIIIMKYIKNYRPIGLLSHMEKLSTRILFKKKKKKNEWKRFLMKTNQENGLVSDKVIKPLITFKQLINR